MARSSVAAQLARASAEVACIVSMFRLYNGAIYAVNNFLPPSATLDLGRALGEAPPGARPPTEGRTP